MLSDLTIRQAKPNPIKDLWLTDGGRRGDGRLVLRISPKGKKTWCFRYTDCHGKRPAPMPLDFDGREGGGLAEYYPNGDGTDGRYSLAKARVRAEELRSLLLGVAERDLWGYFSSLELLREKIKQEELKAAEAKENHEKAMQNQRLRDLCDEYCNWLKASGKISTSEVRSIFKRNVVDRWPDYANSPAIDLTGEQARCIVSALVTDGKGRQAAKLRSYLHAAYSLAIAAETEPGYPDEIRRFSIKFNPISQVGTRSLQRFSKARTRVLSLGELKAYWSHVKKIEGSIGEALRLQCLLGGVRVEQLLRVTKRDIDIEARTIKLYDHKGRRNEPRVYVLPISDSVLEIINNRIHEIKNEDRIFSHLGSTLTKVVSEIIFPKMQEMGEARSKFHLGSIRSTVETHLRSLKVSSDVLAHLQSHGLTGVQIKHYSRYEYLDEMEAALKLWEDRFI